MRSNWIGQKLKGAVWWLSPTVLVVFNLIIVFVAASQSDSSFVVEYDSHKWISTEYVLICALSLFFMAVGAYFGRNSLPTNQRYTNRPVKTARVLKAFYLVTAVCLAAYALWFFRFISLYGFGAFLYAFDSSKLSQSMYVFRKNSGAISGITTFTEFGVVSAVIGAYCLNTETIKAKNRRRVIRALLVLLLCSYVRARLNSERLAVIELIVPFLVAWMGASKKHLSKADRWVPLIALLLLAAMFGAFEYSRSWLTHYVNVYDSFWQFILMRLFGYYTNAINTEALFFTEGTASVIPYWSVQWLWQMPGMGNVYPAVAPNDVGGLYVNLLNTYANPEYNNPGGVLVFYKDFGFLGMPLYLLLGYLVGKAYKRFRQRDFWGIILYPLFFLTLIEMPRYFYLGVNRGFVVLIGVTLLQFIVANDSESNKLTAVTNHHRQGHPRALVAK